MKGKMPLLSLVLSALILVSMNSYTPGGGNGIADSVGRATLDMGNIGGGDIMSFTVGNLTVYFILTAVLYFILRSISSSFRY